ncbi:glutathionylspermidine synthase family protein [Lysinibacillus sp. 1P01SD]|uniref:glutathionylspermidine synthase family protein n=1 Tax=Lysinibacillus sp. 1P01SD TaxID=3132285 RepID=UPI0039A25D49
MVLQVEVNEQSTFDSIMNGVMFNHPRFFWNVLKTDQSTSLNKKEYRPYVYNGFLKLTSAQKEEIQKASEIIYDIIARSTKSLLSVIDEQTLKGLGFPENAMQLAKVPFLKNVVSYISRLDLAVNEKGEIKCLEINPTTPFMINEGFECADMVCTAFGKVPVNLQNKTLFKLNLIDLLRKSTNHLGKDASITPIHLCTASVTASECYEEYRTVEFYREALVEMGYEVSHVEYKNLDVRENGLFIRNTDNKIDVLFLPAYPYEFLLNDDGGGQLIQLLAERQLVVLNPPSSYFMHNKALFALIWGLKDNEDVFSEEDKLNIEKYFIPTYLTPHSFSETSTPYVQKTIFGREGNSVFIFDKDNVCTNSPKDIDYMDFPSIFQKFVDMPKHEGKTIVIGSFLLSGFASGIVARIGEAVTDGEAYLLPVCL